MQPGLACSPSLNLFKSHHLSAFLENALFIMFWADFESNIPALFFTMLSFLESTFRREISCSFWSFPNSETHKRAVKPCWSPMTWLGSQFYCNHLTWNLIWNAYISVILFYTTKTVPNKNNLGGKIWWDVSDSLVARHCSR